WSHESVPLEKILNVITRSVYGFVYLGIFPALAFKLLDLPNGVSWFTALLTIVLLGDVFAYLVGMKWGHRKIIPRISPKKSLEGVMGGIFGSLVGGVIFYYILPDQKLSHLLLLSSIIGGIAQYGDFFESLMKRVADTKDSGSIMPGHGGVLDRIDGVLFAAPIVFVFVQFISLN
nr:phosphatidate cytidylyltransferase [Pseudobdellovibrionaceae bacterium]